MPLKTLIAAATLLAASATPGLAADCTTHAMVEKFLTKNHLLLSHAIPPAMLNPAVLYVAAVQVFGPSPKNVDPKLLHHVELIGHPNGESVEVVGFIFYDANGCDVTDVLAPAPVIAQVIALAKKMEPSS